MFTRSEENIDLKIFIYVYYFFGIVEFIRELRVCVTVVLASNLVESVCRKVNNLTRDQNN